MGSRPLTQSTALPSISKLCQNEVKLSYKCKPHLTLAVNVRGEECCCIYITNAAPSVPEAAMAPHVMMATFRPGDECFFHTQ